MPVREEAIKAIGPRSMAIDVYIWLAYRLHSLTKSTPVSCPAIHAQFGSGFKAIRQMKPVFIDALNIALAVYPEAHVGVEADGLTLHPSAPADRDPKLPIVTPLTAVRIKGLVATKSAERLRPVNQPGDAFARTEWNVQTGEQLVARQVRIIAKLEEGRFRQHDGPGADRPGDHPDKPPKLRASTCALSARRAVFEVSRCIAAICLMLIARPAMADTGAVDIDGDTVVVDGTHWRLAGINAPEIPHPEYGRPHGEPGGPEAAAFMAAAMRGHDVECVQRGRETSYERLVGYCAADGRDLGEMVVRAGWACDWRRFDREGRYSAAQAAARAERRGIWAGSYRSAGCRG